MKRAFKRWLIASENSGRPNWSKGTRLRSAWMRSRPTSVCPCRKCKGPNLAPCSGTSALRVSQKGTWCVCEVKWLKSMTYRSSSCQDVFEAQAFLECESQKERGWCSWRRLLPATVILASLTLGTSEITRIHALMIFVTFIWYIRQFLMLWSLHLTYCRCATLSSFPTWSLEMVYGLGHTRSLNPKRVPEKNRKKHKKISQDNKDQQWYGAQASASIWRYLKVSSFFFVWSLTMSAMGAKTLGLRMWYQIFAQRCWNFLDVWMQKKLYIKKTKNRLCVWNPGIDWMNTCSSPRLKQTSATNT